MTIEQRANPQGTEYRTVAIEGAEVRADDERGDITFEGVASVVDTPYSVRDAFGSFDETVTELALEAHAGMLAEKPPNDGHRRTILDPAATHVGVGYAIVGGSFRMARSEERRVGKECRL